MFRCLRFFLPRRRETVLHNLLLLLIVFACAVAIYQRFNFGFPLQNRAQEPGSTEQVALNKDRGNREQDREKREQDHEKTREIFEGDSKVKRTGPGENGAGVSLSEEEKKEADILMKKWFFNIIASDKISMDRTVPDSRPNE